MPLYDFICDECGHVEEVSCSMSKIGELKVTCPNCEVTDGMRRVYGNAGVVFKGEGWPSKDIKNETADHDIKRQRRKAWLLKDRGDVPDEHVIGLKEADDRFDKKYRQSDLDAQYDRAVKGE